MVTERERKREGGRWGERERNESCNNDDHQFSKRRLAKLGLQTRVPLNSKPIYYQLSDKDSAGRGEAWTYVYGQTDRQLSSEMPPTN